MTYCTLLILKTLITNNNFFFYDLQLLSFLGFNYYYMNAFLYNTIKILIHINNINKYEDCGVSI